MSHRLTIEEMQSIRSAIARGVRHTEMARRMNLSVWTIDRIAVERRCGIEPASDDELPVDDGPADYEAKNLRRCGGCGAMVYVWPCVACLMAVTQRVSGMQNSECRIQKGAADESARERAMRRTKGNEVFRAKLARKAG